MRNRRVLLLGIAITLTAAATSLWLLHRRADRVAAFEAKTNLLRVPVGASFIDGPSTAKVTLIEFADFRCSYCRELSATLKELRRQYGDRLRVVWKDKLLNKHPDGDATLAAEAARAAGEQGKFWAMHDLLFDNQAALDRASLENDAEQLGLDLERFAHALDDRRYRESVLADNDLAAAMNLHGAPWTFINGRIVSGAQPLEALKTIIDEEETRAEESLQRGVLVQNLYDELTRDGLMRLADAKPKQKSAAAPATSPKDAHIDTVLAYRTPIDGAPVRGAADAKVTAVLWSDFDCPLCDRTASKLRDLLTRYPKELRVVWKSLPVRTGSDGRLAALAAFAAGEQGKFWELHDRLVAAGTRLDRAQIDRIARGLAIDTKRMWSAVDQHRFDRRIEDDVAAATRIGLKSGPALVINGRLFHLLQPIDQYAARIDEEIVHANLLVGRGTPPERVFEEIMRTASVEVKATDPNFPPVPQMLHDVHAAGGYAIGPSDAPVEIIEFADFECPYCRRFNTVLTEIAKEYPGKVRIVWRDNPLPMHTQALAAAAAARAAGAQGKFWPMHDLLFANAHALDAAALESYARQLGLDLRKFRATVRDPRTRAAIERDHAEARRLGIATEAPVSYVNGRMIEGAYPLAAVKAAVEGELSGRLAVR